MNYFNIFSVTISTGLLVSFFGFHVISISIIKVSFFILLIHVDKRGEMIERERESARGGSRQTEYMLLEKNSYNKSNEILKVKNVSLFQYVSSARGSDINNLKP